MNQNIKQLVSDGYGMHINHEDGGIVSGILYK